MKKAIKYLGAWVCFTCAILAVSAQSEVDAFRFVGSTVTGSARVQAMGGAFSAVGADYSAAYLNPAGLGLYRRSDLQITTGLNFINTQTGYAGGTGDGSNTRFGFPSVGFVMGKKMYTGVGSNKTEKETGLKSFALSLGYNQIANYNRRVQAEAYNDQNSITQHWAERATGQEYSDLVNTDSFEGIAAWSGLIDTSGSSATYRPAVNGGNVTQTIVRQESGRNNEWTLGLAGNFDNFLYFGGSVGMQVLRYDHQLNYYEEDTQNQHQIWSQDSTPFRSLEMTDIYSTRGAGFNARFGVILRPSDMFRFGISVQTPTIMNLTDTYDGSLYWKIDGDDTNYGDQFLNEGRFQYNLVTPYKVTAGGMFLYKKLGFLTADFELTDYSTTKLSSSNSGPSFYSFDAENRAIADLFSFAYNYRLGAELRYNVLRFRGGFANYGTVLNEDGLASIDFTTGNVVTLKGNRNVITGGIGFKQNNYYLDLAYVRDVAHDRQVFYSVSNPETNGNSPEQIVTRTSNSALLTIGFTF